MILFTPCNGEEIAPVLTGARGVCRASRVRSSPCPCTSARPQRRLSSGQHRLDSGRSAIVVVRTPDRRGVAALALAAAVAPRQRDRILSWRGRLDGRAPRVPELPAEPVSLRLRAAVPRRRGDLLACETAGLPQAALGAPVHSKAPAPVNWPRHSRAAYWKLSVAVCPGTGSRPVYTRACSVRGRKDSRLAPALVARRARQMEWEQSLAVMSPLTLSRNRCSLRQSRSNAGGRIRRQRAPR
jgi:hypothetical protein